MSAKTKRPNQIFICYRREDTAGVAGRIYDRLVQRFGKDAIFKDVDSIPVGRDFRRYIDSIVSDCCVALVVVGDRWLGQSASGASRLDDPRDYVRLEIESVLRRDIPVIPLLVQNATLPPDESLPESLRDFLYRNGMTIGHDPHFHADMDRLIKHLEEFVEDLVKKAEGRSLATEPASPAADHVTGEPLLETDQHPTQVSPEREQPAIDSLTRESPQASATPGKTNQPWTETEPLIAAKDRKRIVPLYFSLWLGVGGFRVLALNLVLWAFGPSTQEISSLVELIASLVLAGGQVVLLKDRIGPAKPWIGYTVIGSVIGSIVYPLSHSRFGPVPLIVGAIFYDLPRVTAQWIVLRTLVKRAWLWIVASVAANAAYSLVASASGYGSGWTFVRYSFMILVGASFTAGAEILCLTTFRRK